ncbi:hypothetical protein ACH4OW_03905 [Streptomyces sp. NPDC017056]|uniref:hypothetical protein n=1 Tax=Streptomyces sp. NPDC017056 TaxID=3364973 RepID=UPI00379FAD93
MSEPGDTAAVTDAAERAAWVRAAARNNAQWCDTVCRAHGIRGVFGGGAWTGSRRTPPLYPDAVTLTDRLRGAPAELLDRIDTASPGCSVKDSFACLDLSAAGFEVLFEAQWIHRPAGAPAPVPPRTGGPVWDVAGTPGELLAWAQAWGAEPGTCGPFRPELLADGGTRFLRGRSADGRVTAGAVVSLGASVVGLSNVFTSRADPRRDPRDTWAGCLSAVTARWPGLPVVGYESGADLEAAEANGCRRAGPLRVWRAEGT